MLEVDDAKFIFKTKRIWFSEAPFDVTGYDGVTFYECTRDVDLKGFSKEEFTTIVIDLTQDFDTLWKNMDRTCKKYIGFAKKNGVIIRMNQDYDAFYAINAEFRKAKGLSDYNLDIGFMKKNGILIVSEYEGNMLGGQFYINDGKNIRGILNSSKRLEETGTVNKIISSASRLMIWEAICYAKEHGMSTYDMGGYYTGKEPDPQKEGINRFKDSFGGQVVTHYIYQKDYSLLYYLGRKILSLKHG